MIYDTDTFQKVLNPADTTAGGGSASAIAGAMAGALIAMVCRFPADGADDMARAALDEAAWEAQALSERLLAGGKEDTLAFQAVSAAYRLQRGDDTQKQARSRAIQDAWVLAARVPLENAAGCMALLEIGTRLQAQISPKVQSDLACALLLARAGLLGCLENVAINLPSIKDPAAADELAQKAADLRRQLKGSS